MAKRTITSFNGGLFSSYLRGRPELEKYSSSLQDVSNYHLLPYGTLQNRAGTYYISNYETDNMRLITFQYNINQSYVIALFDNKIKIVDNDTMQATELVSPYTNEHIDKIQYMQVADTMYLVHPEVPPQKLIRKTGTSWDLTPCDFSKGPFLEYNLTDIELSTSATTGSVTVTASSAFFSTEHVGRTIEFKQVRTDNTTSATSASYSPWIKVKGKWSFSTRGAWTGSVKIYRRINGGAEQQFREYQASNDNNYSADGEETEDNVEMRVYGADSCTATLVVEDFFTYGVVKITGYTDDTHVTGDVLVDLDSTDPTQDWAYNAFSKDTGYPTAICLWNERLALGGTLQQPNVVFLSKIDEWENFQSSNSPYDAMKYKLNTSETIMWLEEQGDLVIGTSGNEYKLGQARRDEPLAGDNVQANKQGADGSTNIQPITAGDSLIFTTRDGKRVKAIAYSFEADKLKSKDLNALSGSEFVESGIKQAVYKQNPYSELYFVLNNGDIAVLTYDQEQNVFGWSMFHTNGKFKSACCLKHVDEDYVYFAVERTINGVTGIYIEKMLSRDFKDRKDWFFVDCGLSGYYSTPTNTVTGLDHLEGETVTIIADGGMHNDQVVVNGQITLNREYSVVHVGLKYQSYAQVMDIDSSDGRQSNQSSRKKQNKLYVKVKDTVGLESGASLDKLERIRIHGTSNIWLHNIQPVTDMVTINIDSAHTEEYAPYFVQSLPQAQEILGYSATVSIGG